MNMLGILYFTAIAVLGILIVKDIVKDIVKAYKSKKMVDKAIDDCFKAIKEKEVK